MTLAAYHLQTIHHLKRFLRNEPPSPALSALAQPASIIEHGIRFKLGAYQARLDTITDLQESRCHQVVLVEQDCFWAEQCLALQAVLHSLDLRGVHDMCFELHAHERQPGRIGHLTSTNVPERLALEIVSVVRPTSDVPILVDRRKGKEKKSGHIQHDAPLPPCGRCMVHNDNCRLQEEGHYSQRERQIVCWDAYLKQHHCRFPQQGVAVSAPESHTLKAPQIYLCHTNDAVTSLKLCIIAIIQILLDRSAERVLSAKSASERF